MSASTRPFSRWRVRNAYTGQPCSWGWRPGCNRAPILGCRSLQRLCIPATAGVAARVRILGRFPRWRPRDACGGSGAPGPGKPRLQPCHPLRARHGGRAPGNIESGHGAGARIHWRRGRHQNPRGQRIRPHRRVMAALRIHGSLFPGACVLAALQRPGSGTVPRSGWYVHPRARFGDRRAIGWVLDGWGFLLAMSLYAAAPGRRAI